MAVTNCTVLGHLFPSNAPELDLCHYWPRSERASFGPRVGPRSPPYKGLYNARMFARVRLANTMALPSAYLTSFKNVDGILAAMQSAQAPGRFTQKFLEGLGFVRGARR